jgi:hypothetical protein
LIPYLLQDAHILVLKGHLMHLHMQMTLVQLVQYLKVDCPSLFDPSKGKPAEYLLMRSQIS